MRRRTAVLALVALVAVAGCTGGGGSNAPGASGGAGGGGAAQGRRGGTLAIALLDPGPLDPARADRLEDEIVLGNLFDGLTDLDPAGTVRPAAAESWTRDPSVRRWEFRISRDARWSDGSPVQSTDFSFAWHRLADPRTRPRPAARTLLSGVTGYRAFAAGRARSIAGLETPDPSTLVVRLDRPFGDLPALVAALPLSPLPAALVRPDPAAYLSRPVGNGPFQLAAPARPGRALTLDRNPAYARSPALLDRVKVQVVPDEQTAWLELQNGRVSFAPVPDDQLAAARAVHGASSDGRTAPGLLQGNTLTTWQLTFNLKSNLGQELRWRQAVSYAVDRDRLAATMAGTPLTTLVPPATPGMRFGGRAGPDPVCLACDHQPARARSLLAATRTGGAPVPLAIPAGADARRIATLLADDLATAGVKLIPTPTPKGDPPVTLVRRVALYPGPDPFLSAPASTSPRVRQVLDQARAMPEDENRASLYQNVESEALADLPAAPLLTEHHAAVLTPGPQGFNLTPWNTLDLAAVSLPA